MKYQKSHDIPTNVVHWMNEWMLNCAEFDIFMILIKNLDWLLTCIIPSGKQHLKIRQ